MGSRLIVGVEGVVHAGKTTLATVLADQLGFHLVPEYSSFARSRGGFPDFPSTLTHARQSLLFFLNLEKLRFATIPGAAMGVVLDRSVISLLAFSYALEATAGIRCFEDSWQRISDVPEWLPDCCIEIRIPDLTQGRRHSGDPYSYESHLLDPEFNARLREFYSRLSQYLPRVRVLWVDGERSLDAILDQVVRFLITS